MCDAALPVKDHGTSDYVSAFKHQLDSHINDILAFNEIKVMLDKHESELARVKINASEKFDEIFRKVTVKYNELVQAANGLQHAVELSSPSKPSTGPPALQRSTVQGPPTPGPPPMGLPPSGPPPKAPTRRRRRAAASGAVTRQASLTSLKPPLNGGPASVPPPGPNAPPLLPVPGTGKSPPGNIPPPLGNLSNTTGLPAGDRPPPPLSSPSLQTCCQMIPNDKYSGRYREKIAEKPCGDIRTASADVLAKMEVNIRIVLFFKK